MPGKRPSKKKAQPAEPGARPSALLDTRIVYCGDYLVHAADRQEVGLTLSSR